MTVQKKLLENWLEFIVNAYSGVCLRKKKAYNEQLLSRSKLAIG